MKFNRWMRYKFLKMKRMQDNPKRLARGLALGVFLNFLPTFGTGFLIAFIAARFLRANVFLACSSALATKWCIPVLYAFNLKVGRMVLGIPAESLWTEFSDFDLSSILALGKPFLLGSILNSFVVSYLSYLVFSSVLLILKRNPVKN